MLRPLISALIVSSLFLAGMSSALADIDNTSCIVMSSDDDPDDFLSLRRKIDTYNRTTFRLCTEKIYFNPTIEYNILADETFKITNYRDGDFNGDGWNLLITGQGSDVLIDGTQLEKDQCVFDVRIDKVRIEGLTIRVWDKNYAICDHGDNNDFSHVTIIETKPKLIRDVSPPWAQTIRAVSHDE